MVGFNARLQDDQPITYEALTAIIKGGQIVVPTAGATFDPTLQGIAVSGDAALNVLGVASKDAVPRSLRAGYETGNTAYDTAYIATDISVPDADVTVYNDVVGYVNFTGACAYGEPICSAVNGGVRHWVTGTDNPAAIIGSCHQPGGVSAAGVGLARIRTH